MEITIEQINSRIYNKKQFSIIREQGDILNFSNIGLFDKDKFLEHNALEKIHNWIGLSHDANIAYLEAINTFNKMMEYTNHKSVLETTCDYLITEMNKVRDAKQLKRSLKAKLSQMKKSINIIKNKNPFSIGNKVSTNNDSSSAITSDNEVITDNIKEECYNLLLNECDSIIEIDRILENYNKICKRYNIDNLFKECMLGYRDLYNTIYEATRLIDTFNSPFKNIYEVALESIWYSLKKRFIMVENSQIIDNVTDYFIFSQSLNESEISDIKDVRHMSPLYTPDNFGVLSYLDDKDYINKENNKFIVLKDKTQKEKDKESSKGNHKEPFSYYTMAHHKGNKGVPDRNDYGVGGRETEKKHYPLYSKLHMSIEEVFSDNSSDIIEDQEEIVVDPMIVLKSKVNNLYDLNDKISLITSMMSNIINYSYNNNSISRTISNLISLIKSAYVYDIDNSDMRDKINNLINNITNNISLYCIDKNTNDNILEPLKYNISIIDYQIKDSKDYDKYNTDNLSLFKDKLNDAYNRIKTLYTISVNNDNIYKVYDNSKDELLGKKIMIVNSLLHNLNDINIDILDNFKSLSINTISNIVLFSNIYPNIIDLNSLKNKLLLLRSELREQNNIDYIRIDNINNILDKIDSNINNKYFNTFNSIDDILKCLFLLHELKNSIINNSENNNIFIDYILKSDSIDNKFINPSIEMQDIYNHMNTHYGFINQNNDFINSEHVIDSFNNIIDFILDSTSNKWSSNIIICVIRIFYSYIINNNISNQYLLSISSHIDKIDRILNLNKYLDNDYSYVRILNKIKYELHMLLYKLNITPKESENL